MSPSVTETTAAVVPVVLGAEVDVVVTAADVVVVSVEVGDDRVVVVGAPAVAAAAAEVVAAAVVLERLTIDAGVLEVFAAPQAPASRASARSNLGGGWEAPGLALGKTSKTVAERAASN